MFYRKVTKDKTQDINKRVRFYLDRVLNDISFQVTPGLASYTYHKLHKHGHPGKPIISANGHASEKNSEFVSYHLSKMSKIQRIFLTNFKNL